VTPNVPFANYKIPFFTTDPFSSVKIARMEEEVEDVLNVIATVVAVVATEAIPEEMKVELLDASSL
jgi:hypothetical protein